MDHRVAQVPCGGLPALLANLDVVLVTRLQFW